jgi:hypothetical protein
VVTQRATAPTARTTDDDHAHGQAGEQDVELGLLVGVPGLAHHDDAAHAGRRGERTGVEPVLLADRDGPWRGDVGEIPHLRAQPRPGRARDGVALVVVHLDPGLHDPVGHDE